MLHTRAHACLARCGQGGVRGGHLVALTGLKHARTHTLQQTLAPLTLDVGACVHNDL